MESPLGGDLNLWEQTKNFTDAEECQNLHRCKEAAASPRLLSLVLRVWDIFLF